MRASATNYFIPSIFVIDVHRVFVDIMGCRKTHLRREHALNVLGRNRYTEGIATNYIGN